MPNKITLKTIEDLNNNECRFPLGKETDPPKYFCGKVSLQDYSYCKKHKLFQIARFNSVVTNTSWNSYKKIWANFK